MTTDGRPGRGHPERDSNFGLRLKLAATGFVAALLALLGVSWFGYLNTRRLVEATRWHEHTESVIGEIHALHALLADAEAGQRGFIITGDERFLESYDRAMDQTPSRLEKVRALIFENPLQRGRLGAIEDLVARKIDWMTRTIAMRRERGFPATAARVGTLRGQSLMDDIRAALSTMEGEEVRLLAKRDLAVKASTARTNRTLFLGGALSVIVLVGVFAVLGREIRERRRAEGEVTRVHRFLDSVVENIPNMIFVKDARDLRFVRLNRAGEDLLGHSRDELIGRNDYDFFPKEEADFFIAKDRQVLASGVLLDIPEEPIRTKARGQRILHTQKVPILDPDGRPLYLLGISEDITDRREAQKEIESLNETLKERSARLEAANRELEAFSYSVSHDLRAPLRHIGGFVDILRTQAATLDPGSRRYLDLIAKATRHMGQLIEDLLVFSRMGRAEMRLARVPLGPLVGEVLREMQEDVKGRRIDWKVAPLPDVRGDPAMLRLVLANLISNAVKYTRPRPEARIEIGAEAGNGETVVFVRDNGVGFDMQYVSKLYGVFQRLHGPEQFEGTGIGLANVRRIVQRHGGRTWAEGEVDRGAAFYFALPKHGEATP